MNDQKFWDYIDGDLGPQEMKEIEKLLQSNEEVRLKLKKLKSMDSMLSDHNLIKAPAGFSQRVIAGIKPVKEFHLSIRGVIPYWIGFIVLNLTAIILTKGEGLLPNTSSLNLPSFSGWIPYVNVIGLVGVGVTLLYFLDKFLVGKRSKFS